MLSRIQATRSRRLPILLLFGLCLSLAPARILASSYPVSISTYNGEPHFNHGFTVPFEYFKDHIFLTLTINDHPGMVFLFDTGSSVNILDLNTSQKLGIQPVLMVKQRDLGYGSGRVRIAADHNLDARIGSNLIAQSMTLIDLHNLELMNQHHLDGILGRPLLHEFVVEVDFTTHLMTFYPRRSYIYTGTGEVIDLADSNKSLAVSVELATGTRHRHSAVLDLDTGSDATLMLYSAFIQKSHITDTDRHDSLPTVQASAFGIGGVFDIQSVVVPYCLIGHNEMQKLPVFLLSTTPFAGRRQTDGVVGTSILSLFRRVIFDEPHGHLVLERRTELNLRPDAATDHR